MVISLCKFVLSYVRLYGHETINLISSDRGVHHETEYMYCRVGCSVDIKTNSFRPSVFSELCKKFELDCLILKHRFIVYAGTLYIYQIIHFCDVILLFSESYKTRLVVIQYYCDESSSIFIL